MTSPASNCSVDTRRMPAVPSCFLMARYPVFCSDSENSIFACTPLVMSKNGRNSTASVLLSA